MKKQKQAKKKEESIVWGEQLLKCNSPSTNVPEEEDNKSCNKRLPNVSDCISYSTCRKNMRKNLCAMTTPILPKSIKHVKNRCSTQGVSSSNPADNQNVPVENRNSISLDKTSMFSNNFQSLRSSVGTTRKPLVVKQDVSNQKIKTKCIDVTWLDNHEEDLTDLLKLESKNTEVTTPVHNVTKEVDKNESRTDKISGTSNYIHKPTDNGLQSDEAQPFGNSFTNSKDMETASFTNTQDTEPFIENCNNLGRDVQPATAAALPESVKSNVNKILPTCSFTAGMLISSVKFIFCNCIFL